MPPRRQVRATPAGQSLLAHVKQVRMMQADLLGGLQGTSTPSGARKAPLAQRLTEAVKTAARLHLQQVQGA
ncbi:hypothetical protein [Limnohabitans sp. WS1]|jgi:hypothetical protein|uniref:hypothetical protein n=1 Tax=Limnohabitans sp. WS1 TaxID=1100726 RepID=UPI000DD18DD7|nr:hypothetical protein [Limnohabitans sp. WS1]PUE10718.1 hypothetical protein B9Z48_17395 [Limnohabitans sp. WS1]